MRFNELIESSYLNDLTSEIITLLTTISAEGIDTVSTLNLLNDLEKQGYAVDIQSLLDVLEDLPIVSTASADEIEISLSDSDMLVGVDADEVKTDTVDKLATKQATDSITDSVDNNIPDKFTPIEQFSFSDDDIQEEFYLRTASGVIYLGEWDPASAYFSISEVVSNPNNARVVDEIPGRLYDRPIEFAALEEYNATQEETDISRLRELANIRKINEL